MIEAGILEAISSSAPVLESANTRRYRSVR